MIAEGGNILSPHLTKYSIGFGVSLEMGIDPLAPWPTENVYGVVELRRDADDKLLQRAMFHWHRDDFFTRKAQRAFDTAWELVVFNYMATARGLPAAV